MELWIRSQDRKTLIKIDNIFIDDEVGTNFCHLLNNSIILGTYNVERAMKIIDEIQKLIKPIFLNTKYNCEIKDGHNKNEFGLVMQPDESKLEIIQPTTIVYEMPKE